MNIFIIQGWRNLWRNLRRTLITISVVAVGLIILIFTTGMLEGFMPQMLEGNARTLNGHIIIQAKGYQKTRALSLALKQPAAIEQALRADKRIEVFSSRLFARGLLGSAEGVRGVQMLGVIPKEDRKLIKLYKSITHGRAPRSAHATKNAARRKVEVMLSQRIADKLKVALGSKVVLKVGGMEGGTSDILMRVCGIYNTGSPGFDGSFVVVHQRDMAAFLKAGKALHQFAIRVKDIEDVGNVTKDLQTRLKARANKMEILPWWKFAPEVKGMIEMSGGMMGFSLLFIFPIVLLGCLNTMSMSVYERTREIGIMKALGTRPSQILLLFFVEAFFIATIGTLIGAVVGGGLNAYLDSIGGLSMRMLMSDDVKMLVSGVALEPVMWIKNSARVIIGPTITVVLATIVAAIFPAWQASRLKPSKAIFFF